MKKFFYIILFLPLLNISCAQKKNTDVEQKTETSAKSDEFKTWSSGESGESPTVGIDEASAPLPPAIPVPIVGTPMSGEVLDPATYADGSMVKTGSSTNDNCVGDCTELPELEPGTLTAGSFDDALNLDIFTSYWNQTGLSKTQIPKLQQPDWTTLVPAKEKKNFTAIDLTFVIDVTGSMGDELEYIKTELHYIVDNIAALFPNLTQRYGLVVYRDEGDEFITRGAELTSDLNSFHEFLVKQESDGGGDYPEAMEVALNEASTNFQWGDDNTAKILFLIADAPPHPENTGKTLDAVLSLKDKNVGIYPVAASGVADEAEAIMRTAAVLTGGQYIFITDDSGVGNSHAEPKFPCYYVEKLNDAMVRVVSDKIKGERTDPDTNKIIRKVGNPQAGVCVEMNNN